MFSSQLGLNRCVVTERLEGRVRDIRYCYMSASGQRENFLPPEGVWEVVRKEEVEYEEPACYYSSSPYDPTTTAAHSYSPRIVHPATTTVTRYTSPVYSQAYPSGVPQSDKPVMTSSPVSLQPGSSAAHGSPGAVVSRRVVRYASPVRSRVTTTTYRCSPESPRPRSDARASAAMATNILPSYETSRRVIYTPRKVDSNPVNYEGERLPAELPEEMARSGSSYPMSCKKTILREMEESAPEPAPNSPQTARASPCDAPAGRRLLAYYEDEEEEDGIENIEMEADPSKPTARYKRSSGSLVFSDSEDDCAGRPPPRKKRLSVKKPPTPLTAIQTQTEDLDQEDEPPREVGDSGGLGSLGGHEYLSLGLSPTATTSRPYLSPCFRERSRELREKEAEIEQFLRESGKRRERLVDSMKKRRRESDDERAKENIERLGSSPVRAVGRWGDGSENSAFKRKPLVTSLQEEVGQTEQSLPRVWKKGTYPPIPSPSEKLQVPKDTRRADDPDPIASHGCFVSEGIRHPERRSTGHKDNRTVFGDASPLPLHTSYHRTVISGVRKLFGEGAPHAPIDDLQWKELAKKLRQQAESHTISVDRS